MWRKRVSGLVRMGPIRLLKIAFDSPARAKCDAHFFIFFCDFYSFLQNPADANPHGVEWMPSGSGVWVWKTKKTPKMENRHHPGQPCAPRRMHIFPHFSEFLLIFQHGSILIQKRTIVCVFVRSFRKIQCGGEGGKEGSGEL